LAEGLPRRFERKQISSLWDALASVPATGPLKGKRYPMASLLLIAMLAGRRSSTRHHTLGSPVDRETLTAIRISRDRVPAPSV
jgi:hypothetical protein